MFPVSTFASINDMTTRAIDDDRITAVGLLMEVHQGLCARLSQTLGEHGLSMNEFEVLLRLARSPGQRLRMSDLAVQTGLTTSGVTRVVDRLEKNGLASRTTCDDDRRGTWATITETGSGRLESAVGDHLRDIDRWYTGLLSDRQLSALTEALRVVRDAVRPESVAGVTDAAAIAS